MSDIVVGRSSESPIQEEDKTLLAVSQREEEDIRKVELFEKSGEMSSPPKDSRVLSLSLEEGVAFTLAVHDGIKNDLKEGEKKIYSSADGALQAEIHLTDEGEISLNKGEDFAVRFDALKKALEARFEGIEELLYKLTAPLEHKPYIAYVKPAKGKWPADIAKAKAKKIKL